MNRREFIKSLGLAVAATALPVKLIGGEFVNTRTTQPNSGIRVCYSLWQEPRAPFQTLRDRKLNRWIKYDNPAQHLNDLTKWVADKGNVKNLNIQAHEGLNIPYDLYRSIDNINNKLSST